MLFRGSRHIVALGDYAKNLMAACYKAKIEGRDCYVDGWTANGTLRLADGSEIAMTPLDQSFRLAGIIRRIARLRRGNMGWMIDGVNLSYVLNDPDALPHWPNTSAYHSLRVLSDKLGTDLGSASPSFFPGIGAKRSQLARKKKAIRDKELRNVVGVVFSDEHIAQGAARIFIPETNIFMRHTARKKRTRTPFCIPILLTRFDVLANKATSDALQRITAERDAAERAAGLKLKEAAREFMRMQIPGITPDRRARVKEAVYMYTTDPEKRSISKIAAEFKVSKQCVSKWFNEFKSATGFTVIIYRRHESVRSHLQAENRDTTGNLAKKRSTPTRPR